MSFPTILSRIVRASAQCRFVVSHPSRKNKDAARVGHPVFYSFNPQISRITGIIMGLRPVVFWIRRFSSARTFSLTMP